MDADATIRSRRAAAARPSRSSSRAGSSSSRCRCCVLALLRASPRRRAGRAALRHRRGHRADPQPARGRSCSARRLPRGAGDRRASTSASVASLAGAGVLLANPVADQVADVRATTCRAIVDSANERLADLQDYFDRKGINIEVKRQGETALQTLQEKVVGGTERHRLVRRPDLLTTVVTAGLRADPRHRLVGLHAHLRRADRRDRALGHAAGRRHARADDFPTRVQRAVGGYVRGQLLFSLAWARAPGSACGSSASLGIFPDGKTYAFAFGVWFGLMELVPFVGPVPRRAAAAARRAVPGSADRGLGRRCSSSRCSSSRATSSRR